MAMKRFSKAKLPKMGKRPMMMAITALVIVFLFWFFFMRGGRSEGFREGNAKAIKKEVDNDRKTLNDPKASAQAKKEAAERRPNIAKKAAAAAK
jgi:hypothetical protein